MNIRILLHTGAAWRPSRKVYPMDRAARARRLLVSRGVSGGAVRLEVDEEWR
jgi:hypothetical protein